MKRRSILGRGTCPAPIRTEELFMPGLISNPTRVSVVPRQLSYSSSQESVSSQQSATQKARTSGFGSSRYSMHVTKPTAHDSVMDGISELSESSAESSIVCALYPPQISAPQESVAAAVRQHSRGSRGQIVKRNVSSSRKTAMTAIACNSNTKTASSSKTSASKSGSTTKIPLAKASSTSKSSRPTPNSKHNTTAVFEENEIAAMTSTPHPNERFKCEEGKRSTVDSGEFAKFMEFYLADQRNMMQLIKMSFQKINVVMDTQQKLNLELTELVKLIKGNHTCESERKPSMNTIVSQSPHEQICVDCDSKVISKSLEGMAIAESSDTVKNVLMPSHEDNKENVHGNSRKSMSASLFDNLKSEIPCLKTPSVLRSVKPIVAETPNTTLSNTIHNQLESLFETSETDK